MKFLFLGKNHATMANSFVSNHDYENMALININRNTDLAASGAGLLSGNGNNRKPGVSHWRSYSNMADGKFTFENHVSKFQLFFSNLSSDCSNSLDLRNLKEQVKQD